MVEWYDHDGHLRMSEMPRRSGRRCRSRGLGRRGLGRTFYFSSCMCVCM